MERKGKRKKKKKSRRGGKGVINRRTRGSYQAEQMVPALLQWMPMPVSLGKIGSIAVEE